VICSLEKEVDRLSEERTELEAKIVRPKDEIAAKALQLRAHV
jgi:hypothetical protein